MSQLELIEPCSDWDEYLLSDAAHTTSGGTPDRSRKDFYNGTIPWVKSGELNDNFLESTEEHISEEGLKKSSAKLFPAGTLLMAMYGATVGKTAILKIEAATNQAVCGISPDETKANTVFLRYQLVFFRKKLLSERYGGAQPNISQTIIKNIRLRLPPLPEQHRIAHVLTTVQTAIEQQARLIALTRELKSALMRKLFTEGLHGDETSQVFKTCEVCNERHRADLKHTEIGLVPESWDVVELGDLDIEIQNGFPCGNWNEEGQGIFQIRPFNVSSDGTIDLSKKKFIETDKDIKRYLLKQRDVIFNNTNSEELVGRAAFWSFHENDADIVLSNHMTILRVKDDSLTPEFLSIYIQKRWMDGYAHSVCQRHVNQASIGTDKIKKYLVPLPSPDEQRQINNIFATLEKSVSLHTDKQKSLAELFRTLLHQLMTGQTRVNEIDLPGLS